MDQKEPKQLQQEIYFLIYKFLQNNGQFSDTINAFQSELVSFNCYSYTHLCDYNEFFHRIEQID